MEDEFEARLEDGSIEAVASDIVRLWKGLLTEEKPESIVEALERKANEVRRTGVQVSKELKTKMTHPVEKRATRWRSMEVRRHNWSPGRKSGERNKSLWWMMMGSLWCRREAEDGNELFGDRRRYVHVRPCIYLLMPSGVSICDK